MSDALAIAATTATLRTLLLNGITRLDSSLGDLDVTTQPLDKARGGSTKAQLNLFLYQTVLNAAWRNMDLPRQARPGETGQPPLALNLYYVITAFGRDGDGDGVSHRVLGSAMSVLHDHPVLGAGEIKDALRDSDLSTQLERLRITPQPLSIEELSKLWTSFQTNYRISAAYEVTVVLIDSARAARTPLPVLTRGQGDSGVASQPDLTPPFPHLDAATPPDGQPAARLGDLVGLTGDHLDGSNVAVQFLSPRWTDPVEVAPEAGATATALRVRIPNQPAAWPAGTYGVAVLVQRTGEAYRRITNAVPLVLAPRIENIVPNPATRDGGGNVTLDLTISPEVRPEQRAALLLADREVVAQPHTAQVNQLTFVIRGAAVGDYFVRVRVDGSDSLLVQRNRTPPQYDPTQRVTVQ